MSGASSPATEVCQVHALLPQMCVRCKLSCHRCVSGASSPATEVSGASSPAAESVSPVTLAVTANDGAAKLNGKLCDKSRHLMH